MTDNNNTKFDRLLFLLKGFWKLIKVLFSAWFTGVKNK